MVKFLGEDVIMLTLVSLLKQSASRLLGEPSGMVDWYFVAVILFRDEII